MLIIIFQLLSGLGGALLRTIGKLQQQNEETSKELPIRELIRIYWRKDFLVIIASIICIPFIMMFVNAIYDINIEDADAHLAGLSPFWEKVIKRSTYLMVGALSFVSDYLCNWLLRKSHKLFVKTELVPEAEIKP